MPPWFQVILSLQTNEKLENGILKNLRNKLSYLTQVYNKESDISYTCNKSQASTSKDYIPYL